MHERELGADALGMHQRFTMGLVIGVDIGGTKISCVLMDENGLVIKKTTRPTEAHKSKSAIMKNITESINELKIEGVAGLGVGVPGRIDSQGNATFMANVPKLQGVNLRKGIEKATGLKPVIENDAVCFALAESRLGAARGSSHILGIIIGTGVGCGIIINGKPYLGATGNAGEAGHMKLIIGHEIKEAEELLSGPNILKRYNEFSGKAIQTLKGLTKEDPHFKKAYSEFIESLGLFLANMINIFNPEAIVFGGGVSNIDFYKDAKKALEKHTIPGVAKDCKLLKNKLGDDAGVLGAALLALG
jgi:fructokinase